MTVLPGWDGSGIAVWKVLTAKTLLSSGKSMGLTVERRVTRRVKMSERKDAGVW